MKNFKRSLIGLSLLACAPQLLADVGGSAALTTDYQFRGITQSAENPAIQVSFDYSHDTGFYVGAWGSTIDFSASNSQFDINETVEVDIYLGYSNSINDIDYDINLTYYTYPGVDININYAEIYLSASYKSLSLTYAFTDDLFAVEESGHYINAVYDIALPNDYSVALQAGYSFGNAFDSNIFEAAVFLDAYLDYSISLNKSFNGIDVSLSYVDTDISGDFALTKDEFANDGRFIASISKTF